MMPGSVEKCRGRLTDLEDEERQGRVVEGGRSRAVLEEMRVSRPRTNAKRGKPRGGNSRERSDDKLEGTTEVFLGSKDVGQSDVRGRQRRVEGEGAGKC